MSFPTNFRAQRDKGWAQVKFPCIGFYSFLEFSIGKAPHYETILARLKNGATLLDMGCCFGQDIRKLVSDGASGQNLTGTELEPVFVELGYELFQDRETLGARFETGDVFAEGCYGLEYGTFDFVHTGSFFHQFTWQEQVEALRKCLRLLKPKGGSMLIGRQIAAEEPGTIQHAQLRSGEAYNHDVQTWKKLVAEVTGQIGLNVKVEVELDEVKRERVDRKWKMMKFCLEIVES